MAKATLKRLFTGYRIGLTLLLAAGVFFLATLTGEEYYFALHPRGFLPIHTVAELFSIVVAFSVFAVGWYTPRDERNPRVHVLSAAFLAVGLLDLAHTLAYTGMPPSYLIEPSANRATLLWLAARIVAAAGLFLVAVEPFIPRTPLRRGLGRLLYPGALAVAVAAIAVVGRHEAWLPVVFSPGVGLTSVKVWTEIAVVAVMGAAGAVVYAETLRREDLPAVHFVQAIIFLFFGELSFTLYRNVYDVYNLLGHAYKVLGYYYIFQAAYVANVRRPYEELQRLVFERTADLERALAELKEVDQLKDEFVSGLSHDLRTPLVPVKGFIDMLLAGRVGPLNPKQEEFLGHCRRSVEREAELIDELLDYSRLRAGRMQLDREVIDLRAVLRDAVKGLESMAMQQGLKVEAELGGEPVMVEADRAKLLRVFGNLFSNAVKFNRDGGLVRVELITRAGGQAAVSVEDTGPGIAPEEREKVFERFYQINREGHSRKGAGIGLWTVREIVRLHGGRVELASEPGQGSRFTVVLSLAAKPTQ